MIRQYKKRIGLIAGFLLLMLSFSLVFLLQPAAEYEFLDSTYYEVKAVSSNPTMGSATATGSDANKNEQGFYLGRTDIVLTASIANDKYYQFDYWSGPDGKKIVGSEGKLEYKVILTTDQGPGYVFEYTANFSPKKYNITYELPSWQITFSFDLPTVHTYGTNTDLPTATSSGYDFVGWIVNGDEVNVYPPNSPLGSNITTDIVLKPKFEPIKVQVTCQDIIKNTDDVFLSDKENGHIPFEMPYGTQNVKGTDAPAKNYRGYYYVSCTTLDSVQLNPSANIVKRYYSPKTYQIIYRDKDTYTVNPLSATEHVYGQDSLIFPPSKTGYRFLGWTIENENALNADDTGKYNAAAIDRTDETASALKLGGDAFDSDTWTVGTTDEADAIVLVPRWERIPYSVTYEPVTDSSLPTVRYYDEDLVLPNLSNKEGYTFLGWRLKGSSEDYKIDYVFSANQATGDLTFESGWRVDGALKTDDVTDGSITSTGSTTFTVIYGNPLPAIEPPTRTGYTFTGYFYHAANGSTKLYYKADGTCADGVVWDMIGQKPELYAHWQINQCTVDVNSELMNFIQSVTINGQVYDGSQSLEFNFGTEVTVTVIMKDGYKLVQWLGEAIEAHSSTYTYTFRLTDHTVLNGSAKVMLATPNFTVNYLQEIFEIENGIPAGRYLLICGEDRIYFTVAQDGLITFEADSKTADKLSAVAYLGKEIQFVLCGDGVDSADSAAQSITVARRPAAPTDAQGGEIGRVIPSETTIQIELTPIGSYLYEFAYSTTRWDGVSALNWQSASTFTDLKPGTPYYLYVRVAASESYPHGEVFETERTTMNKNYLQQQQDKVMDLKIPGDGDYVDKLIQEAVQKMASVETAPDYVNQLEEILQEALKGLDFARAQDQNTKELQDWLLKLTTDEVFQYSEDVGIPALQGILDQALLNIQNAKTVSEVQRIAADAKTAFSAVLISYLYFGEDFLLSCNGIDSEYRLAASRVVDLNAVTAQIARAVQAGTIVVGGTQMELKDALQALQSMDVVAYYNLRLVHPDAAAQPAPTGPFEIRLLIPVELRGNTGWMVAYYQHDTEELKVLDTRREGNYLIFTADSVENFVILADHAVSLTGILIALSATLLCQLIAIVMLLVRRSKFAKEQRSYAVTLPLIALTVRFFPENAKSAALLLSALVVLMQIVLMWLLLTSDVIVRKKTPKDHHKDRKKVVQKEEQPTEQTADEQSDAPAEAYLTLLTDAPAEEGDFEAYDDVMRTDLNVGDEAEPDLSEASAFEPDPETEVESEDAWYGDDDFIEPAANPRYSLPDEAWDATVANDSPYEAVPAEEDAYTEEDAYGEAESLYAEEEGYEADPDEAYAEDAYDDTAYSYDGEPAAYEAEDASEEDVNDNEYDPMAVFDNENAAEDTEAAENTDRKDLY